MARNVFLLILAFFSSCFTIAQEVNNIRFEQEGNTIYIYYDLSGEGGYEITVYCSQDGGFTWGNPLTKVSGEVGINQKAGNKKMITWDVLTEWDKLQGDIQFKIEALGGEFAGNSGTFTDLRDGKIYKWVKIGEQIWMEENLNYKKTFWSKCYDENRFYCDIYGRLYYWKHANIACPQGWHLPSDSEWMELIIFLGGEDVAGGKMKQKGTAYWEFPNAGATNSSGFNALPGGRMQASIQSFGLGIEGHFWTSYMSETKGALEFYISNVSEQLQSKYTHAKDGLSIRCIQD